MSIPPYSPLNLISQCSLCNPPPRPAGVEQAVLRRYSGALAAAGRAAPSRWVRGPVYGLCLCAPTLGYAVSLAYGGYLVAREGLSYEYAIL